MTDHEAPEIGVLLLGDEGVGKSTFLSYVDVACPSDVMSLHEADPLPQTLDCRSW